MQSSWCSRDGARRIGGTHQAAAVRSRSIVVQVHAFQRSAKRLKYSSLGQVQTRADPLIVTVSPDGSDAWRLAPVIEMLKQGKVGIIPTDTLPALVADLENRDAVIRLYTIKELDPKKPLSILCKGFQELSHYTTGLPANGFRNWFSVCRRILPGPYTLLLPASKNLPSQCVDFLKGKTIHRKSVGVRIPGEPICQAVLAEMGTLLSTSVHVPDVLAPDTEVPDMGQLLEAYGGKGLDFIVDVGPRIAIQSTIVDMTGPEPVVVRQGAGGTEVFE